MPDQSTVRPVPCVSCPYRRSCPSGVWAASEYDKLTAYDGDATEQVASAGGMQAFGCHQGDGQLCAGWVGHRDPHDLIALKVAIARGTASPDALDYTTDVPLFASGAEAAGHGKRDIEAPSPKALEQVGKITRVRAKRGEPVDFS
jgi:hypothetical protein